MFCYENQDITPRRFRVESQATNFKTMLEMGAGDAIKTKMGGTQFPIVSNTATTGHKLQGCTVKNLLVNDWHCGSNWAYVVLSRVKKMKGLYLQEPLSTDLSKYAMKDEMREMLDEFRKKAVKQITDSEYDEMIHEENREEIFE